MYNASSYITMYRAFYRNICCIRTNSVSTDDEWYNGKNIEQTDYINAEWKNTTPFVPPVKGGKVIKVYDGDTITIASKLPYMSSPMYRFTVRLNGIDCAEIKGHTFNEKEIAVKARDALSNMILGKWVELRNVSTEKYGRILADVYYGGVCVNTWMLENGHAVIYDGGTKQRPSDWDQSNLPYTHSK